MFVPRHFKFFLSQIFPSHMFFFFILRYSKVCVFPFCPWRILFFHVFKGVVKGQSFHNFGQAESANLSGKFVRGAGSVSACLSVAASLEGTVCSPITLSPVTGASVCFSVSLGVELHPLKSITVQRRSKRNLFINFDPLQCIILVTLYYNLHKKSRRILSRQISFDSLFLHKKGHPKFRMPQVFILQNGQLSR